MIHEIQPHQYHIEYTPRSAKETDCVTAMDGARLLAYRASGEETQAASVEEAQAVSGEEKTAFVPTVAEAKAAGVISENTPLTYLFSVDDTAYFAVLDRLTPFGNTAYVPVTEFRYREPKAEAFPAAMAHQLLNWYHHNRYCGCCGKPTVQDEKERALRCPSCGNLIYPVINIGVIVAVKDHDRLLITRYPNRPPGNYALVAGYIESGETAEDTVRREVMEEVGLKVKNIRYYKSQPWPFTSTLLLGYYCELDGSDAITLQEEELEWAAFVDRDKLPKDEHKISLTMEMIERFHNGLEQ